MNEKRARRKADQTRKAKTVSEALAEVGENLGVSAEEHQKIIADARREIAEYEARQEYEKTQRPNAALPGRISNAGAETNIPVRPFQSFPKPGKK